MQRRQETTNCSAGIIVKRERGEEDKVWLNPLDGRIQHGNKQRERVAK